MTKARGDQLQELITAVLVCVTVRSTVTTGYSPAGTSSPIPPLV